MSERVTASPAVGTLALLVVHLLELRTGMYRFAVTTKSRGTTLLRTVTSVCVVIRRS